MLHFNIPFISFCSYLSFFQKKIFKPQYNNLEKTIRKKLKHKTIDTFFKISN